MVGVTTGFAGLFDFFRAFRVDHGFGLADHRRRVVEGFFCSEAPGCACEKEYQSVKFTRKEFF